MSGACGIVVLISGSGTNLQALLDEERAGCLPGRIVAVISNRHSAGGLRRAQEAGIETRVLPHDDFPAREHYDQALQAEIDQFTPGLVVLAGFMRILSPAFVLHYQGRMLNIHPSLLPAYRGLHTHRRVLAAGDREHGCSVHFVTPDLDAGPVVVQARVPVLEGDTERTLAARVQTQEHRIYPLAVGWFASGRLVLRQGVPHLDEVALPAPVTVRPEDAIPRTDS